MSDISVHQEEFFMEKDQQIRQPEQEEQPKEDNPQLQRKAKSKQSKICFLQINFRAPTTRV